jgi:hypothetical protein
VSRATYRRRSLAGALILVTIGVLFLIANFYPAFDVWEALWRYWPVILIIAGAGKLADYFLAGRAEDPANPSSDRGSKSYFGETLAIVVILILCVAAVAHSSHRVHPGASKSVIDLNGAKSVHATINMHEGALDLSGGAGPGHALEGDFFFDNRIGEPGVNYSVSNDQGSLDVAQPGDGQIHLANDSNQWNIRLSDAATSDLHVNIGAGSGKLRLGGLSLDNLEVDIGAGSVDADLSGDWKKNVDVQIRGGVGSATVHLPKNIGVEVDATSGIGSVLAPGMRKEGGSYVNDAYGKSPVAMHVTVEGGIGTIRLVE